jgi:Domain of unknown function (DUF4397)
MKELVPVRKFLAILVSVLAAMVAVPIPAGAAAGSFLRLAHLSPDTPKVDVTVTAFDAPERKTELKGVGYGDVSEYQTITPGSYTVAMRPAGADPSTEPVISTTLDAVDGRAYTVAGLGAFADLALRVLADDISLPPPGQSRMRVVNAAPRVGDLMIRREGTAGVGRAVFGQASSYVFVPAGTTTLSVEPAEADPTSLPVTLKVSGVYTILVLEKEGTLSAVVRQDAQGSTVVPHGAVEAGFGGQADGFDPVPVLLGGAVVLGLLVLVMRRRRAA